jgi:hypothetical protein
MSGARRATTRHILHAYFIWNPRVHHELADRLQGKKASRYFSFSAERWIERARREHEDLLSEFSSLLSGVEQTLVATDMGVRRMSDDEMFLEAKRSLNPAFEDRSSYRRGEHSLTYCSARVRLRHQHRRRAGECSTDRRTALHLRVLEGSSGRTFPEYCAGVLNPVVVNAGLSSRIRRNPEHFKGRLRQMQAAQRDSHGGFKVNIEAQVAQGQLQDILQR